MSPSPGLRLTFWGVRGSVPTPDAANLGYGGNTACLEVRDQHLPPLIFDAGTGLRRLGLALMEEFGQQDGSAHLFLTHFHWDHIQGLPFFPSLYRQNWDVALYSGGAPGSLQQILDGQMRSPYFSAGSAVRARCTCAQASPAGIRVGELLVRAFPLNHPDGSVGYRIEAPQGVIVYTTDHEHGDEGSDVELCRQAQGADILIYDAQYTPEEYELRKGWGHSTWLEATRLARQAGVGQLVLFHHDPEHDDTTVSRIVAEARGHFPNTVGAQEGWSVSL